MNFLTIAFLAAGSLVLVIAACFLIHGVVSESRKSILIGAIPIFIALMGYGLKRFSERPAALFEDEFGFSSAGAANSLSGSSQGWDVTEVFLKFETKPEVTDKILKTGLERDDSYRLEIPQIPQWWAATLPKDAIVYARKGSKGSAYHDQALFLNKRGDCIHYYGVWSY